MPQMEKTYPAGVISVGYWLLIWAVVFPPKREVLANPLTASVIMNARMFPICRANAFLKVDMTNNSYLCFYAYRF
jgi:hypothetical protein